MQMEDVKEVLTCGNVAKICNVSARTVCKWIDTGLLIGYRIPGSRDRRVTKDELLKFMAANKMPFNIAAKKAILFLCKESEKQPMLVSAKLMEAEISVSSYVVSDPFSAGIAVGKVKPHVIVVDCDDIASQLTMLHVMVESPAEIIVATSDRNLQAHSRDFDELGIVAISKPYNTETLIQEISKHI